MCGLTPFLWVNGLTLKGWTDSELVTHSDLTKTQRRVSGHPRSIEGTRTDEKWARPVNPNCRIRFRPHLNALYTTVLLYMDGEMVRWLDHLLPLLLPLGEHSEHLDTNIKTSEEEIYQRTQNVGSITTAKLAFAIRIINIWINQTLGSGVLFLRKHVNCHPVHREPIFLLASYTKFVKQFSTAYFVCVYCLPVTLAAFV